MRPVSVWETRSSSPCTAAAIVAQPLVVHHEGLDFVLGERGVFGVEFGLEVFLRGFEPGFGVRLLVEQGGVVFEGLAFLDVVGVIANFL